MSTFLLLSSPLFGHVTPMVSIGRGLLDRGHRVTLLTGRKYRRVVEAAGLDFLPLPAEVDYDDAQLGELLPPTRRPGSVAAARASILAMFVRPLVAQHRAVTDALHATAYDAVLAEVAYLGVLPLLSLPAAERLPVAGVSVTPLSLNSVDCAPFGSGLDPGRSAHTRRRNRFIRAVLEAGPLRPVQAELDRALAAAVPPATVTSTSLAPTAVAAHAGSYFDQAARFDLTFQLAVPGLEYPRRELPPTLRFVGPLPAPTFAAGPPSWWPDLQHAPWVAHVTQGTLANADLRQLIVPALRGLADEDGLVVVTTGGRPVSELVRAYGGPLPGNARVAEFLPYDRLLPRTDVVVTNGGFGGVQQALAHGIPLVVAGSTEDKPEVAARVAWSGAGVNLRTGQPSPRRVRRAVRRALREPDYRRHAERLRAEIAEHEDPVGSVASGLEQLTRQAATTSA